MAPFLFDDLMLILSDLVSCFVKDSFTEEANNGSKLMQLVEDTKDKDFRGYKEVTKIVIGNAWLERNSLTLFRNAIFGNS